MALNLEVLLITFVFLTPGFLTSRLLEARTPALSRRPTPFEQTLESLLRSAVIHLIIAVAILGSLWIISPQYDAALVERIGAEGLSAYYSARPLEALTGSILWLCAAFILATLFGCVWDPIDFALNRVAENAGLLSVDVLYFLRRIVADAREETDRPCQLWVQARLNNGYTYQGEFVVGGYRREGKPRELLLANVKFFPFPAQAVAEHPSPPKAYDYAVIDLSNCLSLEFITTDAEVPDQVSARPSSSGARFHPGCDALRPEERAEVLQP